MIEFLLAILICPETTDCRWMRIGMFRTEDQCIEIGESFKNDKTVVRFKCVVEMRVDNVL